MSQDRYPIGEIVLLDGKQIRPELEVIEWKRPAERSLVLCDARGAFLARLAPGIQAPGFNFTAYVKHDHLRELARSNSLELEELHPDVRKILDGAKSTLKDHFRKRAADEAAGVVDAWRREDIYPYRDPPRNVVASVITSKAAIRDRVKTGHTRSDRDRII